MSCTACRKTLAPGTWASLGRRRAITWSALSLRSLERLQRGEQEARVGLEAAGEADHVRDRRILADDADELAELPPHRLEGDALVGADAADDAAGVLLREEALGDLDVQEDVEDDGAQEHDHGQPRMVAARRAACGRSRSAPPSKTRSAARASRPGGRSSSPSATRRLQDVGAHHRRGGERDHHRDQDGDRQRHRELAEQPADDAAHQQDRDEHRDQRQAHRHHGEADLARAEQRRLACAACPPRYGAGCSPAR